MAYTRNKPNEEVKPNKPVRDNVRDNVGDNTSTFTPNWQRLAKQYPDKIKSKADALRFILFSLGKNHPEATFILGNRVYGRMDRAGASTEPQYIKEWQDI